MNTRAEVAALLLKFLKLPKIFTVELYNGEKYQASLSNVECLWIGFEDLENTRLNTPNGVIKINAYEVKGIY